MSLRLIVYLENEGKTVSGMIFRSCTPSADVRTFPS